MIVNSCFPEHKLLPEVLKEIFSLELPGVSSQLKMAPDIRKKDILKPSIDDNTMDSAVLFLIYPENGVLKTILTQRPVYNGIHSGQISFPGGKREFNESLEQTALREANEEIGLQSDKVEIIGSLTSLFIPPSNYIVKPFIGLLESKPDLIADNYEVSEIIDVELDYFFKQENRICELISLSSGEKMQTPCFNYKERIIWGATAMIIMEFVDLVEYYCNSKL